jgi:hypothetical protein
MTISRKHFRPALLVALALLINPIFRACPQTVSIPDPGLQAAIRLALGKAIGDITVADMQSLTLLNASSRGVKSTEGLGAAVNLVSLWLSDDLVTNFSGLGGLDKLAELNLCCNQLTSPTFPPSFTNLKALYLTGNRLTNFSFLEGLPSLNALDLAQNQLTSVTMPTNLNNLIYLDLYDNLLTSLTLPPGLSRLEELNLGANRLNDFSFLAGLTRLTTLSLSESQLTSLTLPPSLTSLADLELYSNPLDSISIPAGLPYLFPTYTELKDAGVRVTLFPVLRSSNRMESGEFAFEIFADIGAFTVLRSTDLKTWTEIGSITVVAPNYPGTSFTDTTARDQSKAFYQLRK